MNEIGLSVDLDFIAWRASRSGDPLGRSSPNRGGGTVSRHGTSPGAGAVGVSCLLLIFSYFYRIQPGKNAAYTEDQSGEGRTPASPRAPHSDPQRARQRTA